MSRSLTYWSHQYLCSGSLFFQSTTSNLLSLDAAKNHNKICRPSRDELTEVHQSYGHDLRLPLQAECRAKTVIHEGPGHLDHLMQLGVVSLQTLGVLQEGRVGMVHLQVELDGL